MLLNFVKSKKKNITNQIFFLIKKVPAIILCKSVFVW